MAKTRSAAVLAAIIFSAIAATALGFWGFMDSAPVSQGAPFRVAATEVLNNVWRTIGLFIGQGSLDVGDSNLKLAIARVLAPVATAGVILEVLADFLGDRFNALRGLLRREHTIIVGCGERGLLFLDDCRCDKNSRPVVLDRREEKAIQRRARDAGALYFVGDARSAEVLSTAGLSRAKRLLIVCGNDADNLAVLAAARGITRKRAEKLEILVRIDDPFLARQLNRDDHFVRSDDFDISAFNVYESAARHFLATHPLVDQADLHAQNRVHLVCVGWTPFILAVVEQLARLSPFKTFEKPLVSLLVPDDDAVRRELKALQPALFEVLDIDFQRLEGSSGTPTRQQMAATEPGRGQTVTAVLVSTGNDAASASVALAIRERSRHTGHWRAPVYAHVERRGTLSDLLAERASSADPGHRVVATGFTEDACRLDAQFSQRDLLARQIHRSYLSFKDVDETTPAGLRAENDQEWADLRQTYRIACRRSADHLPVKLLSAGAVITDTCLVASPTLALAAGKDEMESLADLEHQSWAIDRFLDGWQHGEHRDNESRRHPALVPYAALREQVKDFDRDQVRALANTLIENNGESTVFREFRIGLFGHNKISKADKAHLLTELEQTILPNVLEACSTDFVSVCTPLAPGADTILAEAILERLAQAGIPHRLLVIRTLPVRTVADSFLENYFDSDEWRFAGSPVNDGPVDADKLIEYLSALPDSVPGSLVAEMTAPGLTIGDYAADDEVRLQAFERAAAWLVERCDLLIAFVDESREPGRAGTAATLQWAEGKVAIPDQVSTLNTGEVHKSPPLRVIRR